MRGEVTSYISARGGETASRELVLASPLGGGNETKAREQPGFALFMIMIYDYYHLHIRMLAYEKASQKGI